MRKSIKKNEYMRRGTLRVLPNLDNKIREEISIWYGNII